MTSRLNRRSFLAVSTVVAIAVVALGPRPAVDTTLNDVELPPDLGPWLAETEGRFDDITPGAEKRIVWADSAAPAQTELAVVYLHGFSATRQETRPLTEEVARALGANAYLTRLRGHGRSGEAMAEATVNDWLNDVAEAMAVGRRLGDRVVLMGTSTGATLVVWAAAQDRWREDLAAAVLLSPNFKPADPAAMVLTWPWGGRIARAVIGPYRQWEPANELQARYWTHRYPTESLLPMAALVRLVAGLDLSTISTPTLVLYSHLDEVVSLSAIEARAQAIGGRGATLVDVGASGDPTNHVLAGDILSPETTAPLVSEIVTFVRSRPAQP